MKKKKKIKNYNRNENLRMYLLKFSWLLHSNNETVQRAGGSVFIEG